MAKRTQAVPRNRVLEVNADPQLPCKEDVDALYSVLHEEVIPLYYERGSHKIPHHWIARMKHALRSLAWRFNADRMVIEYARKCYQPVVGCEDTF